MFGILEIINLVFLGYASYFDVVRKRSINDSLFYLWAISVTLTSLVLTILPNFILGGILFLLFKAITDNKKFGMADTLAISIMALTIQPLQLGLWIIFSITTMVLFVVVNGLHTMAEKKLPLTPVNLKRYMQRAYPFFPFMAIGYLVLLAL